MMIKQSKFKSLYFNNLISLMFYCWNGRKYNGIYHQSYGQSMKQMDIIGVYLDMDKRKMCFFKNGKSQGLAFDFQYLKNDVYYPVISLFDLNDQVTIIPSHLLGNSTPKGLSTNDLKKDIF